MQMISFKGVLIEPDEIVSWLRREMQLKEICQKILHQRIIHQAATERGITITALEIQAEANQTRYEKRLEKASDTLLWLADQLITADDWEAGIRERLLAKKLAESLFAKDVEKFFSENKLTFEQVLLYQIVVPYEQLAQEIFYQIEENEISFYQAAHLYDIDERRRYQCGYEGKINRGNLKPEIAAVVFNAPLGETIGPLKSEQGYHILMIEEFLIAELTPEKYQDILQRTFNEWLAHELIYMLSETR